jgi:KTSC domain
MQLQPVNSSAINAIGWESNHLYVQFHNNPKIYDHPGFTYSALVEFMSAPSLGTYYNQHIRGRYG